MSIFRFPISRHLSACLIAWPLLIAGTASPSEAQAFQVSDIDPSASGRGTPILRFAEFQDEVYFSAFDPLNGHELWRTDGSESGTGLVRDLCPGPCDSIISPFFRFGQFLFFVAQDQQTMGLWRSDGSNAGTSLVTPLRRSSSGNTARFFDLGDRFLIARESQTWSSDGTAMGTSEISLPTNSSLNGVAVGSTAFFTVGDSLWKTDGTSESTVEVASVPGNFPPRQLSASAGRLYFVAGDDDLLWQSDGTAAGTQPLAFGMDRPRVETLRPAASRLYFFAYSSQGFGLWRTDGSETGTVFVAASELIEEAVTVGDRIFYVRDGVNRDELWTSDGTATGTYPVGGPVPGTTITDPRDLTPFGDGLIFKAGGQLLRTSGSATGAQTLVAGLNFNFSQGGTVGDHFYFSVRNFAAGDTLWRTDGTPAGTAPITSLQYANSSDPSLITALDSLVVFAADDGFSGEEPWRSDGSRAGTLQLEDVRFGPDGPPPLELAVVGDSVFFSTGFIPLSDSRELWRTDGTPAGTTFVGSFRNQPTVELSTINSLLPVGDQLYFSATDGEGAELWRSDGSEAGTQRVRNILEGTFLLNGAIENPKSSFPEPWAALGSILYLSARGDDGRELWRSDGTEAGTWQVKDIFPGAFDSSPSYLATLGNRLYFTATDGEGQALWRSDGSEAGTEKLFPVIVSSSAVISPQGSDQLYWLDSPRGSSPRLWRLDGNDAVLVSDLALDGPAESAADLFAIGDLLYFTVNHPDTGVELWTSDGTAAGTGLLKDIQPGIESSAPQSFSAVDGRLLFAASQPATGLEPWISDGTEAGTVPLPEIAPGFASSSPSEFTAAGDLVYFAAADPQTGRELWAIDRQSLGNSQPGTSDTALYLNQDRFEVEARWDTGSAEGVGQPVRLTEDSGYFWFFNQDNVEVVVKVLDACDGFDRFWVFIAGLTNVEVDITVRDRQTGAVRAYNNPLDQALLPVQDTDAFATCP